MAGLYIHIPFCASRCIYCDFYSEVKGDLLMKPFVEALKKELCLRKGYLQGEPLQTIYFGGGTPSSISPNVYQDLFEVIHEHFQVDTKAEITLEANPDDLSKNYLQALADLPFNRLSIGIQSFVDEELTFLNRRHNAQEALDAVSSSREAGIDNISIDLIYGLPGQTRESWKASLETALSLQVPHISAYSLTYEEGTKLWSLLATGKVREVDEELSLSFFNMLMDDLSEAGYEHYEVSNFCKPGFRSRHNSSYWEGVNYLGLGPSAHSYDGISREWNVRSIQKYIEGIKKDVPIVEKEILSVVERYNDLVITRLRTQEGIRLADVEAVFGVEVLNYLLRQADKHQLLGHVNMEDDCLFLTRRGLFVSDGVMVDLMMN